MYYNLDHTVSF